MPKGPLIENREKREVVVALLMGVFLFASLLIAYLITGAKLGW